MSYELFFSEQIFAPNNPECEIAVVGETEEIVINDELARAFDITQDYIYGEAHRRYEEKILKNVYKYRKGALLSELAGSNILLVDDGCQTGATALVAIKTFINLAAKSVFYAAPVIPTDLAESLISVADGVYCARKIADYVDSDFYYKAKIAPEPDEILRILEDSPHYLPLQKIVN
jgi:putative phosphoribosyl transferase